MRSLVYSNRCVGVLAGLALTAPALLAGFSPTMASADSCPNAALRTGLSATLPDCRAYEMVTPVEKNGGSVDSHLTVQAAPGGDAIAYASPTALPDSQTSIAGGYNLARRTSAGWEAKGLEPPQLNSYSTIVTSTQALSQDLSKALVVSRLALAPGAVEGDGNVYLKDTLTGQYTLIDRSSNEFFFNFVTVNTTSLFGAGSPDLSHVVLSSSFPLAPDGSAATTPLAGTDLYEWSPTTESRLVNRLPDGSVEINGARVIPEFDTQNARAVSTDGSRVVFQTAGGLYMREHGSSTRLISASQRTGDDPTVPHAASFSAASADGSLVYFMSGASLADNSTPIGEFNSGYFQLYRYEVETNKLEAIGVTSDPEGPRINNVSDVTADGAYVYFSAYGALAPGAIKGDNNLYVWHEGTVSLIGAIASFESVPTSSVSPDGKWYAFASYGRPTGYDNASTDCPGSSSESSHNICSEVFLYSVASRHLACLTCNPAGVAHAQSSLGNKFAIISRYVAPNVLDDGTTFFQTGEALVPADSNGKQDVYEFSPERGVSLISSGTGKFDSQFEDMTPDATNVFFRTGQQLVGQDTDDSADMYDARVGGGFPGPARSVACSGTACQGVPPAPPIFATPPSVTFNGVGNFDAPAKAVAKPKAKPKKKAKKPKQSKRKTKRKQGKKASKSRQSSTRRAGR